MAMKIGAGLALDGEKEFKKAVSGINKDLAVLGSEMGKVTAQFGSNANSMDALKAKSEVYNKQIDEQKKKIETLKSALANSAKEFGENDVKTKNWQISLNKAEADLAKTENALKSTTDEMEDFGKSADDTGKKFGNMTGALKGAAVAIGAVAVAAGAAAVAMGKAVVGAYADYEQLVGGVDTLFESSSQKVQEYANDAFKTAGLSANEYMETVTSFSASLLQSLGGDTEKAAEYADRAIIDMSDNANKMGTDMASIQNAYQGFAKQNYTMLDNLKLGYGGTKTEMERLLKDAGKIAGVKFDISSYADVTEAIHVMQVSMGIAGTTALEAEKTISGSISAMGGAWENLLVGFGNSNADIEKLMGNLIGAFENVVGNITPVIENIAKSLPQAFEAMGGALGELLPTLVDTVVGLFGQILDTLIGLLPEFIPVVVDAIMTIVDTLIENLPLLIDAAFQLITALAEGILVALPELVPKIVEVVNEIVTTITENLPLIVGVALQIIVALTAGIIKAIPGLVKSMPEIITAIVKSLKGMLSQIVGVGADIVKGLWDGIKSMITWLEDKISDFVGGIVDGIKGVLGIRSPSKVFAGIGENMALGLGAGFESTMNSVAKNIDKSIPTPSVGYSIESQPAPSMLSTVAGMFGQNQSENINLTIQIDGQTLARQTYEHFRREGKLRGTPLVQGV